MKYFLNFIILSVLLTINGYAKGFSKFDAVTKFKGCNLAPLSRTFSLANNLSNAEKTNQIKNVFDQQTREKVKRIIVVDEHSGISYRVLNNAVFIPALFNNFPNAEIVYYGGTAHLIKPPDDRKMIISEIPFKKDYWRWEKGRDETVSFFFWQNFIQRLS